MRGRGARDQGLRRLAGTLAAAAVVAVTVAPGASASWIPGSPILSAPQLSSVHRSIAGRDIELTIHADPRRALASRWLPTAPAKAAALPSSWCGEQRSTDDRLDESGSPRDPKIKVIDAYPSDRNPQASRRSLIQATIKQVVAHVAAESGQRKSLRYDLGTSCGARYVDIQTVKLPRPTSAYDATCPQDPMFQDVQGALDDTPGLRDYIIFALDVNCGAVAGYATLPGDATPGADNATNAGGYMAVVFDALPEYALHETGHNLGAVQLLSPHSDVGGHCWDEDDVMCYPYTSLLPKSPLRPCDLGQPPPWDCGHDDYFNPAPAAGSYLANHWNTFNSVFMCPVATCAPPTFGWSPQQPRAGESVTFSSGDGQDGVSSEWDFGDGAPPGAGSQPAHVYGSPGRYEVKLRVVASDGAAGSATRAITVGLAAVTALPAPTERATQTAPKASMPPKRRAQRRSKCTRKRVRGHTRKRCKKPKRKSKRAGR